MSRARALTAYLCPGLILCMTTWVGLIVIGHARGDDALRPDRGEDLAVSGPRVETTEGILEGLRVDNAQVFRGIPYAAPPTGVRRWQPPREVEPWTGVRRAVQFSPACPQPMVDNDLIPHDQSPSEDCLSLNVAAPVGAKNLPVWVMIHGGGFAWGSGEYHLSLAPLLNEKGIVMVTLNYRLSALGFFAHPELDGSQGVNYGLMDMIAGLQWVKRNIAAFGGNPNQVTLSGLSAGGMSVDMLMVTPASANLISGAIAESGYGTWPRMPRTGSAAPLASAPSAEAMALEFASRVTGKPADEVTREDLYATAPERWAQAVQGFHVPIVDGISLPEEPGILFALGKQHPVPFMSGGTSYDGSVFNVSGVSREALLEMTDGRVDRMRTLWAPDFEVSEEQGLSRFFGDMRYVYAAWRLTRAMQNVGQPGYLYMFEYVVPEKRGEVPGATHGADLEAMWLNLDWPISETMRSYKINFAKTGNPNGEGLLPWPTSAGPDSTHWLVFGDIVEQEDDILETKLNFVDQLWTTRVAPLVSP